MSEQLLLTIESTRNNVRVTTGLRVTAGSPKHDSAAGKSTLASREASFDCFDNRLRYDTRCFNVRSKADISQLNLPHGTDN